MNIDKREVEETITQIVKRDKVVLELDPEEVAVLWTIALYLYDGERKIIHKGNVSFGKELTEKGLEVMSNLHSGLLRYCPNNPLEGWVDTLQ